MTLIYIYNLYKHFWLPFGNQTWLGGQSTIQFDDFPSYKPSFRQAFQLAIFEDRKGPMGAPVISRDNSREMGLPHKTRDMGLPDKSGFQIFGGFFLWNMGTRNIDKDNYPRNQYPPSYKWRFQFSLGNSVVHICSIAMFDCPRVHPEMIQSNIWSIEVLYHTS